MQARTHDLAESLEQQTATSEVLRVIYSSPGELEPVFNAILENATRICEANFGVLFRFNDDFVEATAMLGVPLGFAEFLKGGPFHSAVGVRVTANHNNCRRLWPRTRNANSC